MIQLAPNDLNISKSYVESFLHGYRSEGYDRVWKDNFDCPSIIELTENSVRKNSKIFLFPLKLMQANSSFCGRFDHLANLLAVFLQYRDDFECLFMKEEHFVGGDPFATDFDIQRFTLPFVHAIAIVKNQEIIDILKQKSKSIDMRKRGIAILKEIGTEEYCIDILNKLDQEIRKEISLIGPNPLFEGLMDKMRIWDPKFYDKGFYC
jgi:geranylgeranyl diphosphate synthase, type III